MSRFVSNSPGSSIVAPPVSATTVDWIRRPRVPSPELERLRRLAKKFKAPAAWFADDDECPFVPVKKKG